MSTICLDPIKATTRTAPAARGAVKKLPNYKRIFKQIFIQILLNRYPLQPNRFLGNRQIDGVDGRALRNEPQMARKMHRKMMVTLKFEGRFWQDFSTIAYNFVGTNEVVANK